MNPALAWAVGLGFVLVLAAVATALIIAILCDRKDRK